MGYAGCSYLDSRGLVIACVLFALWLPTGRSDIVHSPCGGAGDDRDSFEDVRPRAQFSLAPNEVTTELRTFFQPTTVCDAVESTAVHLPFPSMGGQEDSTLRHCKVIDPTKFADTFKAGSRMDVMYGDARNNITHCCCCSATVPVGVTVIGATLRIIGETHGFTHRTVYPFQCELSLHTRGGQEPMKMGEQFTFSYIAEEDNMDGSPTTQEVLFVVLTTTLICLAGAIIFYAYYLFRKPRRMAMKENTALVHHDDEQAANDFLANM